MKLNVYRNKFKTVPRKYLLIFFIFIISFLSIFFYFLFLNSKSFSLTKDSVYKIDESSSYFNLSSENEELYISDKRGKDAVYDFLEQFSNGNKYSDLFPKNLSENIRLNRVSDTKKALEKKEHYFFEQSIKNIPVYGSSLVVHLRNDNTVYSINGYMVLVDSVTERKLTDDQAMKIAVDDARKDTEINLIVRDPKSYYFNEKLFGKSENGLNRISLGMYVDSEERPLSYSTFYIVDLQTGEILYKESQVHDALNRFIYNCSGGSCNNLVRTEGSPPSGVADADSAYSILGDVYNFFYQNFNRDSYDDRGAQLDAYTNVPNSAVMTCPNASWTSKEMVFCSGLAVKDIGWHELVHAITFRTARLVYQKQSGAINESISDIFAVSSDNNWTIGEDVSPSIGLPIPLRSMSDPTQTLKSQPDKLFSNYYYCGGLNSVCDQRANDHCGVHINSGVINKTFYLMTEGGSFNGCTMSGVGLDRSTAIMYEVLTNYLTNLSNFYDVYISIQQACNDLYGSGSDICTDVEKAAQATELDQQTPGTQVGPLCANIQAKPATCSGAPTTAPIPTSTPTNTPTPPPGATNTPTPTLPPGTTPTNTPTPSPTSIPSTNSTPTPTRSPFIPQGTPTPTPEQYFTCQPDPNCVSGGSTLQLCPLICTPK